MKLNEKALEAAPIPSAVGEDAVERVAEAINAARYDTDMWRDRARPSWADEDRSSREYAFRLARAALASSEAKPCGVKALEWEEGAGNYTGQMVWSPKDNIWPCWIVKNPDNEHYVWCEEIGIEYAPASPVMGVFSTLNEAKAAAQADFERRILSCLSHPAQGWREPEGFTPYLWQCKDYADSWISYANKDEALAYQRDTGCLLRITYRPTAPAGGSDA